MSAWPHLNTKPGELIANAVVRMMLGKLGAPGSKERPLAVSFIRLTAKAAVEYTRAARADEALRAPLPNPAAGIEAMGEIENCVTSLNRALLFLDGLKARGLKTDAGRRLALRPASYSVLAQGSRTTITKLRDSVMHMDERIRTGTYPTGTPIALGPHQGRLELEGVTITVAQLATWLDQLGSIASTMAIEGVASPQ